jgi:hypothetical protein
MPRNTNKKTESPLVPPEREHSPAGRYVAVLDVVTPFELAYEFLLELRLPWFTDSNVPVHDVHMLRLLLSIYVKDKQRAHLSKKEAWQAMGVADIKTARKYIAKAEQAGLIETFRSGIDKRRELLRPLPELERLIEEGMAVRRNTLEYMREKSLQGKVQ